jgi:hypothetical protein
LSKEIGTFIDSVIVLLAVLGILRGQKESAKRISINVEPKTENRLSGLFI